MYRVSLKKIFWNLNIQVRFKALKKKLKMKYRKQNLLQNNSPPNNEFLK